jgi:hypothetical protein
MIGDGDDRPVLPCGQMFMLYRGVTMLDKLVIKRPYGIGVKHPLFVLGNLLGKRCCPAIPKTGRRWAVNMEVS